MRPSDLGHFSAEGLSALRRALARAACAAHGHDWREVQPRAGEAVELVFGRFSMCLRCGRWER